MRIGIPALIVGVLMIGALWRLGTPRDGSPSAAAPAGVSPLPEIGAAADVLLPTSIGRRASLTSVRVLEVTSARTFWIGDDTIRVFVVLDPDVKRQAEVTVAPGAQLSLVGLVRRAPAPDVAIRQWSVDPAVAETVRDGGIYLYVTEVRAGA